MDRDNPAGTCARHCEGVAYQNEIRRLKEQLYNPPFNTMPKGTSKSMTAYRVYDPESGEFLTGYNGTWIWRRYHDAKREADKRNKYLDPDDRLITVVVVEILSEV